jgi:putative DNA primase/helicase
VSLADLDAVTPAANGDLKIALDAIREDLVNAGNVNGGRILTRGNGGGKDLALIFSEIIASDLPELEEPKALKAILREEEEPIPIFTRCAAEIRPVPVEWLWKNRLARGKLTIIASDPGLGKSLITVAVAATVSSGGSWPAGEGNCEAGSVLLATYEDDLADTVVPRLKAAGADLSRVNFLDKVPGDQGPRYFDLARDADRLDNLLGMMQDVCLLIVDPVSAAMGGVDSHKNSDVRAALHPLVDVAQRRGIAVLAVSHFSKGAGGKALHRVIGSIAFTAAARIAFIAARDDDDPTGERHLLLPIKSNIGDDRTGLSYTKEGTLLPDGIEAWRIKWGGHVTTKADDVMVPQDEDRSALGEAKKFLESTLERGPVPVARVKEGARKAGITDITLRRAKGQLRVTAQDRDENGVRGEWTWRLPQETPASASQWEEL